MRCHHQKPWSTVCIKSPFFFRCQSTCSSLQHGGNFLRVLHAALLIPSIPGFHIIKLPFLACLSRWHDFSPLPHPLPLCALAFSRSLHTHNYIINFVRGKWSCTLTYLFPCWLIYMRVDVMYLLSLQLPTKQMPCSTMRTNSLDCSSFRLPARSLSRPDAERSKRRIPSKCSPSQWRSHNVHVYVGANMVCRCFQTNLSSHHYVRQFYLFFLLYQREIATTMHIFAFVV